MKPCSRISFSTTLRRCGGALEIRRGIGCGRRSDDARQHRGFGHGEIGRRLAEVAARGRFRAVEAIAEIHLVQIDLENLVLAVELLDPLRENRFAQFAAKRLVAREKADARELLRDRARAFGRAALADVGEHGADDADAVDAVVVVETRVFDSDDRILAGAATCAPARLRRDTGSESKRSGGRTHRTPSCLRPFPPVHAVDLCLEAPKSPGTGTIPPGRRAEPQMRSIRERRLGGWRRDRERCRTNDSVLFSFGPGAIENRDREGVVELGSSGSRPVTLT